MQNEKMNGWKSLILDMDGVLWRGETPMPGLTAFFRTLQERNIRFVLATNNATKIAEQYSSKLERFGIKVPPSAILTSAEATASHLRQEYPDGATVYIVGDYGLREYMQRQGFHAVAGPDGQDGQLFDTRKTQVDLVVVGFTPHVVYRQFANAVLLINNGARFIGTNPDVTLPHESGLLPGAGAFLALIQAATGKEPLVVGKPGRIIFEEAIKRLGTSPSETAMVGDRLQTDIAGAGAAGIQTILLLSGVTNHNHLQQTAIKPDLVLNDLRALTEFIVKNDYPRD